MRVFPFYVRVQGSMKRILLLCMRSTKHIGSKWKATMFPLTHATPGETANLRSSSSLRPKSSDSFFRRLEDHRLAPLCLWRQKILSGLHSKIQIFVEDIASFRRYECDIPFRVTVINCQATHTFDILLCRQDLLPTFMPFITVISFCTSLSIWTDLGRVQDK